MSLSFTLATTTTAIGAGLPSAAITITLTGSGTLASTASFALSDSPSGGQFYPSSPVTIASGSSANAQTQFVYIPPKAATGSIVLTATASGGLTGSLTLTLPVTNNATVVASDTFTGSAGPITSHTPDVGGAYTLIYSGGSTGTCPVLTSTGKLRANGTNWFYSIGGTPVSVEYDVSADSVWYDLVNGFVAIGIHAGIPASGSIDGYYLFQYTSAYGWALSEYNGPSASQYWASGAQMTPAVPTDGSTVVRLSLSVRMINNLQYIIPLYNGTMIGTPFQNGDVATIHGGGLYASTQPGGTNSDTSGQLIDNFLVSNPDWKNPTATSFTISGPATGSVGAASANFTVSPNGVTSGVFTPSGGGGGTFSPSSLTFTSSVTPQTFTYTPAATGTFTINGTFSNGITNSGAGISFTASSMYMYIYPNSTGIYLSSNWDVNGSSYAQTNNPGAYIYGTVTNTTQLVAVIDCSILAGIGTAYTPLVAWSVNGGAESSQSLNNSGTMSITLASGLSTSSHYDFIFRFKGMALNGNEVNRWNEASTPYNCVRFVQFNVDNGGYSAVTPKTKLALIKGDSITEGAANLTGGFVSGDSDGSQTFGAFLSRILDAEFGITGFASQGYTNNGNGSVPNFFDLSNAANSTWDKYSAGRSRLLNGAYVRMPDYIFIAEGVNDLNAASGVVQTRVYNHLLQERSAAAEAWIFQIMPFYPLATKRGEILAGFTEFAGGVTTTTNGDGAITYRGITDTKAALLDLGPKFGEGIGYGGGVATQWSYEGTHPSVWGHAEAATRLGAMIIPILSVSNMNVVTPIFFSDDSNLPVFEYNGSFIKHSDGCLIGFGR